MTIKDKFGSLPYKDEFGNLSYGYIFDEDRPEEHEMFAAAAAESTNVFNQDGQPNIVTFDVLSRDLIPKRLIMREFLKKNSYSPLWWDVAAFNSVNFGVNNQGSWGTCAGFSAANGAMVCNLYQMIYSDAVFTQFNPIGMFCKQNGFSTVNGATMSAMLNGGNKIGHFPVDEIGEYDTKLSLAKIKAAVEPKVEVAKQYQIGACEVNGVDEIIDCLKAFIPVNIGNQMYPQSCKIDNYGFRVGIPQSGGAHATLFDAYVEYKGIPYIGWLNSWGKFYTKSDLYNKPETGCWVTLDGLKQMLNGRYCDTFATYCTETKSDVNNIDLIRTSHIAV